MTARFTELSTLELHELGDSIWNKICSSLEYTPEQAELWREFHEVQDEIDRRREVTK